MMKLLPTMAFVASLLASTCSAMAEGIVKEPFGDSALTDEQKKAWAYAISEESLQYGCRYGDDPRLADDPKALLESLAKHDASDPVQVTLRTWLSLPDNVRALVQRNFFIASMECNKVYVAEGDLIGMPVIPFEEFLGILLPRFAADPDIKSHVKFIRSVKVASMDVRWFWGFFVVDRDHLRLLGYDYETLAKLEESLPKDFGKVKPETVLHSIYRKLFSHGLYVPRPEDGKCVDLRGEPSKDAVVFKNIGWPAVKAFYDDAGVFNLGEWRPALKAEGEGLTIVEEQPVEEPANPYFNVTRGAGIQSRECK